MELPINQVICADCLDIIKNWPDKCVNLCLTDPPYGISADKGSIGYGCTDSRRYEGEWDKTTPDKICFDEILRASKTTVIWGGNYFTDKLPVGTHWLVWDKVADIQFDNPFSDCELAWTSSNRSSIKKKTIIQQGFVSQEKTRYHPTQKPVALGLWILENYSKPDDIILDCYCGSGSFLVAAKLLKRQYIGIDISPEYCKIAEERLNAVDTGLSVKETRKGQIPLFP